MRWEGWVILGEGLYPPIMMLAPLTRQEAEGTVSWCSELPMRLKNAQIYTTNQSDMWPQNNKAKLENKNRNEILRGGLSFRKRSLHHGPGIHHWEYWHSCPSNKRNGFNKLNCTHPNSNKTLQCTYNHILKKYVRGIASFSRLARFCPKVNFVQGEMFTNIR